MRPGDVITGTVTVTSVRADKPITGLDVQVVRDDGVVAVRGTAVCWTEALGPTPCAPLVLERGAELDCLEVALHRAATGTGSVVLVSGEAGIGKTSLVRAFVVDRTDRARILLGACDDLVTPRALGPLRDAVRGGGPLAVALAGGDRDAVLSALLAELADGPRPTVLVLEDVHWADDATLDVLRYIGRRVADLPRCWCVTYRDEEVGPSLQRVLGALGGPTVHRLALARLSRAAVPGWSVAPRSRRRRSTGSRRATRSSSRRWPPPPDPAPPDPAPCQRRSSMRCSPGSSGSIRPSGQRWNSSRWCRPGWSCPWRGRSSAT